MNSPDKKLEVLDCKASDHEYLHKDFHGALCYGIKYLDDTYGQTATAEYLQRFAEGFYAPLIAEMKRRGLSALEDHWRDIFTKEGGGFSMCYQGQTLVLTVDRCPAIEHLKNRKQLFTQRFCETTVVVNETICREAGYACSCEYVPGQGQCVQKFWKESAQ